MILFKVGDRAIIVGRREEMKYPELAGTSVVITGTLRQCNTKSDAWFGYPTDLFRDGACMAIEPQFLRKIQKRKRLAKDFTKTVPWSDCAWKPSGVKS